MRCPDCGSENVDKTKFCNECGARLEVPCPNCQTRNPCKSKFCNECGKLLPAPVSTKPHEHSFDEKISKIRKYLPEGLTQKILSQKDRIEGEKRRVTVMFCDMAGYSSLAEKLGPEGAYTLMDQIYDILTHKVSEYGGTVNELTGDGVMALFGAPIAMEGSPQRAVRAALAIHSKMVHFSQRMKSEQDLNPIMMRIGIHTGPVVVGTVGNDLRVDFKAVGDTVNLASRMESLAEPGTTYVTESLFKLTEGLFRFENLGNKMVKGRNAPIKVYRVIAASNLRSRFDVSAERGLSPFVGRNREIGMLIEAFDQAKQGSGQVFSIIGEAGIGKSRILYEFRKSVANEEITFLEGKCLSYGKYAAYHPIVDLLKSTFDVQNDDDEQEVRRKVEGVLELLNVNKANTPFLLELQGMKNSGIDKIPMSLEARKERTAEAVRQIVLKGAQRRPLVIAIEDLHWVDKATEEIVRLLLDAVPGSRLLLVLTYRPEFGHAWGGRSYYHQVNLSRLSHQESLLMVREILDADFVDLELQRLIVEKTEGVPFFLEEFVKSLQSLDVIKKAGKRVFLQTNYQEIEIPSTIQEIIMAKVDSLSEGARDLLQAGAAIEREFSYILIRQIAGIEETELLSHLEDLKAVELLYERDLYPNNTYVFRHAMTRDVVYDSILVKTRKQLHERIGSAIEQLWEDNREEYYAALVRHFAASENHGKTSEYARLACMKAEKNLSLSEAVVFAEKWIDALEKLSRSERSRNEVVKARVALGFLHFRMSNMADAQECIQPIAENFMQQDLQFEQGQALVIMGSYKYMVEEDFPDSINYLEKAISMTERSGDAITSVYAHYMLGLVLAFNCEFEKAIQYFEVLLGLSEALAYAWRISVMKSNLSIYGYNYHGMVAEGFQSSHDAVSIAEGSGDVYSKAMAYTSHGVSCYYKGLHKEAKLFLEKGIDYTQKINMMAHNALAHEYLGHVYIQQEEYREAQEQYEKTIHIREKSRLFPSSANLNRIALSLARCLCGEGVQELDLLCKYARENRVKIYEGTVARYIGEILLNGNNEAIRAAESWIQRAIQVNTRNGMICNLGWDHILYSKYFAKIQKPHNARNCMKKAVEIFERCGADGWAHEMECRSPSLCA